MLRRELAVDVTLEDGSYGSFQVRADDEVLLEGGALAFLGVLPSLAAIRAQVKAKGHVGPQSGAVGLHNV